MNALLRGKLVVATRTSVTSLYFPRAASGVLVPRADPGALAAAVRTFWDEDEARLTLAEDCQEFLLREHSAHDYSLRLVELVRRLRSTR